MKYIEHYTKEGDLVFDGFCGTGMTGVAAQLLNRKAILSDLSPIATFIAYNYNKAVDAEEFEKKAKKIIADVEKECGWMYHTLHPLEEVLNTNLDDFPEDYYQARIFDQAVVQEKIFINNKSFVKGKINYTEIGRAHV